MCECRWCSASSIWRRNAHSSRSFMRSPRAIMSSRLHEHSSVCTKIIIISIKMHAWIICGS